jgi:hypothetical protein
MRLDRDTARALNEAMSARPLWMRLVRGGEHRVALISATISVPLLAGSFAVASLLVVAEPEAGERGAVALIALALLGRVVSETLVAVVALTGGLHDVAAGRDLSGRNAKTGH